MNDHQKKLYDLLLLTDRICRENGIKYYLSGGGALGAVRHRGFLPWDDDVDLYFFREDYEKLQAIRDQLEENDLVLCDSHYYEWYDDTLPRLSAKDSAMLTKSRIVDDTANGYFMEIFVLDPMPRDHEAREEWLKKHWLYAELLKDAYIVANSRVYDYTDEIYFEYRKRFETEGREKVLEELEKDLFSIEMEDADECCSRWGMRCAIYDIEWLGEPKYMLFEDAMLPVPSQVEKFLRADFGDSWVMIPESDDQGTWHNIASNDHISYQYYVDDYMQFLDADEIHKTYIPRKDFRMRKYFNDKRATGELQNMKKMLIDAHYKEFGVDAVVLKEWAETGSYDKLEEYFGIWTRTQLSEIFKSVQTYINIGDDNLYYALLPLIHKGEYSRARSILEWRMRTGELEGMLLDEYEYLKNIGDAYEAIYEKDIPGAAAFFEEAKQHGFAFDRFNRGYLDLYLRVYGDLDAAAIPDVRSELKQMISEYPERPELLCLLADVEFKAGNLEEAKALYEAAREDNHNGLLLLHIGDQLKEMQAAIEGENRE
ncbi:MAG: LicD family protein [Firmicutes bacterium]|nr:LicD family protein [Bacillota bacterium]